MQRLNRIFWRFLGPADFQAPLNHPDQIRGLHRLVKVIDDDTIELRSFGASKHWVWLLVSVLAIGGWVINGPMSKNVAPLPKPLLGLVAPDYYGEWITKSYEADFPNGEFPPELDRAVSVAENAQSAREEWKTGVVILILFTFPPLWWLFGPIPRGVRVDRRRKLIYSWKWFSFYCIKIRTPDLQEVDSYFASPGPFGGRGEFEYGHLIYALPKASKPATTRAFSLGRGPTPNYHQYTLMHHAAASFLYHKNDPGWLVWRKTTPRGRNNWIDWIAALASFHLVSAWWPRSTQRRLDAFAKDEGKIA